MKLVIMDTEHFEVLDSLLYLFEPGGHSILVCTNAATRKQLSIAAGGIGWVIQNQDEPKRSFASRCFREIRDFGPDLIFLSTVADNHLIYYYHLRRLGNVPVLMTLHDINSYLLSPPRLNWRSLIRSAGKKKLLARANALHVLNEPLADYLQTQMRVPKPVYAIPGRLYDPNEFPPTSWNGGSISIVIPGSVDQRRRNYPQAFELLGLASERGLDLRITFLGAFSGLYSGAIRERAETYQQTKDNLVTYGEEVVDREEFDRVLRDCQFIWMPVQPHIAIRDGIVETYGESICSGNTGDIIRFAKPFLTPGNLKTGFTDDRSGLKYQTVPELSWQLAGLNPDAYKTLESRARSLSGQYTKELIRKRFDRLFRLLQV